MNLQTHIDQALDRVQSEQTHVAEKEAAFEEFERNVREIPAVSPSSQRETTQPATGGLLTVSASAPTTTTQTTEDRYHEVREAFAETVRPYSIDNLDEPESLLATIGEELGEDLAVALAPETGGQFTATTKQAVLSAIAERRQELSVMEQALDAEEQSLRSAIDATEEITNWLIEANESSLTDLGFDELQVRHETLAEHRSQYDQIAFDRQAFLDATTSRDATVGINHRTLVEYLYAELPINYPVLVTSTRLDDVCADCQCVVRDHLVRQV